MRNLHKKISVVVLAGLLLVGGIFSKGLISYANSAKSEYELDGPLLKNELSWDELKNSDLFVKEGRKVFDYIIYVDKDKDDNLSNFIKKHHFLSWFDKYFRNGQSFISYIYQNGMNSGMYDFWIGGRHYRIYFKQNVKPALIWNWWVGFPKIEW